MIEISAVCPLLNEDKNVQRIIDFFVAADPSTKELYLVDGGSTDETVSIIERNMLKHKNIFLLRNHKRIVPCALNLAIPHCKGRIIVRLDGHSAYAPDYFKKIIDVFSATGADIVGGPTRTHYESPGQEAIAYVVSHPFGIGGSKVHDEAFEGYTDSVTFGAWKSEIFKKVGYFDERLVRNQDDEFHYRGKSCGFKIYQHPDIRLYYSPRNDIWGLFKQYFQYGFYKPLVLRKVKSEMKLRHILPSAFVLYLLSLSALPLRWYLFVPLVFYMLILLVVSFSNDKRLTVKLRVLTAFPCLHISYGIGFVAGLTKLFGK